VDRNPSIDRAPAVVGVPAAVGSLVVAETPVAVETPATAEAPAAQKTPAVQSPGTVRRPTTIRGSEEPRSAASPSAARPAPPIAAVAPLLRLPGIPVASFSCFSSSLANFFAALSSVRFFFNLSCSTFSCFLCSLFASLSAFFFFASAAVASLFANTYSNPVTYSLEVKIMDCVKSNNACCLFRFFVGIISGSARKLLISWSLSACSCALNPGSMAIWHSS
jgi:hypothetical protein